MGVITPMNTGETITTELLQEIMQLRQRVHELEASETSLRESEIFFRRFVENSGNDYIVYSHDMDGNFTYVSPRFATLVGKTSEEVIGKNWRDVIRRNLLKMDVREHSVALCYQGITPESYHSDVYDSQGNLHHLEMQNRPVFDAVGQVIGVEGIAKDITQQKLVELALQKASEQLEYRVYKRRAELEKLPQNEDCHGLFMMTDTVGICQFEFHKPLSFDLPVDEQVAWVMDNLYVAGCNDTYAVMHGYDNAQTIIGKLWSSVNGYDPQLMQDGLRHWLEHGYQTHQVELMSQLATGEQRWFSITDSPVIEDRGITRQWAIQIDITERKRIEQRLQASEAELSKAQEAAHVGSYTWNIKTGEIGWSNEVRRILGYPPDIEPSLERLMTRIHSDDLEQVIAAGRRALEEEDKFDVEYRLVMPDGSIRIMHDQAEVIRDVHGQAIQMVGMTHDITEHKLIEDQQIALAQEKERIESMRTLIANASHDIKTPLVTINTALYLLEKLQDPDRRQEKLNSIRDQVFRMEGFIQDLIAIARLGGIPKWQSTGVDLNALIFNIEKELRSPIEHKRITVDLDFDEALPVVYVNYADIRRALVNLIENALDYSEVEGTIQIMTRAENEQIAIEIVDDGMGISEQDLPHIFERFYRSDQAQRRVGRGSGLGLAIVHKIIEMHSGSIEVESKLFEGSRFRIQLPISPLSL